MRKGQRVTKRWVLKNTGAQYIPQGSCLMTKVSQQQVRFECKPLEQKVGSGETFDVEVCFDAPMQNDRYIIEF